MKWMSMREFLRGGYRFIDDITVVSNHGRPVFTVHPFDTPSRNGTHQEREEPVTARTARGRTPSP